MNVKLLPPIGTPITLKQLYEAHPEWHDHQMVVYCSDGTYDYINCAGMAYEGEDHEDPHKDVEDPTNKSWKVLVFSPN